MRTLLLSTVLLGSVAAATAPATAAAFVAAPGDSSLLSEKFSVDSSTAVPGTVLKSGSYVIRVVDHMSDRSILRIENQDGKVVSTFLGVPNRRLSSEGSGAVSWAGGSGHEKALRGYNFPGSFSVEFVYPKAEAVKIALAHSAAVEAIDPPSDNLPSKEKNMTSDDLRIVTLWTLSPTRVSGSDKPAIAAEKYKPEIASPAPAPVVARNETPAELPAPRSSRVTPAASKATVAPTTPMAKAPARRPVVAALPHTASELPAVLLAGMLSLVGIVALRGRRLLLQQ